MRAIAVSARLSVAELIRYPGFSAPTLCFPALLLLIFGADDPPAANRSLAAFSGFAVLAVAFFQFGVGTAVARETVWESYLRTLPVGALRRLCSRGLAAFVFAAASAATVALVAVTTGPARLDAGRWAALAGTLTVGLVPFGLLGVALGYLVDARTALPIANLLYLGLTYLGGLWQGAHAPPLAALPDWAVPTRAFGSLLIASVEGATPAPGALLGLAGWALAALLVAVAGYRRVETRQYR